MEPWLISLPVSYLVNGDWLLTALEKPASTQPFDFLHRCGHRLSFRATPVFAILVLVVTFVSTHLLSPIGVSLCLALAMIEYTFYRLIRERRIRRFRKFSQNSRNCTQGEAEQCNQPEAVDAAIYLPGLNRNRVIAVVIYYSNDRTYRTSTD